mgnify:CR=1 FL=1
MKDHCGRPLERRNDERGDGGGARAAAAGAAGWLAGGASRASLGLLMLGMATAGGCGGTSYDAADFDVVLTAAGADTGSLQVTLADGGELVIEQLVVAVETVGLRACVELSARRVTDVARGGLAWLISPSAHAHSPSTPTRSGVPLVLDVLSAERPVAERALRPPTGNVHCGVDVGYRAADDDAIGIDVHPEQEGYTLRASGRISGPGLPGEGTWDVTTSMRADARADFAEAFTFTGEGEVVVTVDRDLLVASLERESTVETVLGDDLLVAIMEATRAAAVSR